MFISIFSDHLLSDIATHNLKYQFN